MIEQESLSRVGHKSDEGKIAMTNLRDDVVFLGEISCPDPYDGRRVPVYRVVLYDHPMYGQVITEQQVLQSGLFHSGLAAGFFPRVTKIGKN